MTGEIPNCPECSGTGIRGNETCGACNGTGNKPLAGGNEKPLVIS